MAATEREEQNGARENDRQRQKDYDCFSIPPPLSPLSIMIIWLRPAPNFQSRKYDRTEGRGAKTNRTDSARNWDGHAREYLSRKNPIWHNIVMRFGHHFDGMTRLPFEKRAFGKISLVKLKFCHAVALFSNFL